MKQWARTSWISLSVLTAHLLQLEAKVNLYVQVVPKSLVEKTVDIWWARWEQSWPSLAVLRVYRVRSHSVPKAAQIDTSTHSGFECAFQESWPGCPHTLIVWVHLLCGLFSPQKLSPEPYAEASVLCSAHGAVGASIKNKVDLPPETTLLSLHSSPEMTMKSLKAEMKCTKINLNASID